MFKSGKNIDKIVKESRFYNNNELSEKLDEENDKRYRHGKIECIEALKECLSEEEFNGFCKGNVIKYLWRCDYKGGKKDLEKARDYLNYLLE